MQNKKYKTKQRSILLDFFEKNTDKCFSAKELIKNEDINLGEATIYRSLSKFVDEGLIKKFISPDSDGALYQYNRCENACSSHFHLKCVVCGSLFHMECDMMNEITYHIKEHHNFKIDNSKTVLYGLCNECDSYEDGYENNTQ